MSEYTNRISDYLAGIMSPEEKEKFEADLLQTPEMKEEYQLLILAKEVYVGEPDLERILNDPELPVAEKLVNEWMKEENDTNINTNHPSPKREKDNIQKPYRVYAWVYLVAASLFFAFLAFKYYVIPNRAEKIFLSFYETIDPAEFETDDIPPETLLTYQTALDYFESGDFNNAAATFRTLYELENENPDIMLMLGISEMENGQLRVALKLFEEVSALQGANVEYASFYTGLCHVRLGDPRAAIIYLADITGLTENLDPAYQKMIKRAYLIYTFQFKQLRKEMSEDEEPSGMIGPTQKRILITTAAIVFLVLYLIVLLANRASLRNTRSWIWLTVIFFLPVGGSVLYLLLFRKKKP